MLGSDVARIDDMNGMARTTLLLARQLVDGTITGRLSVYAGASDGLSWSHNISASTVGPYFGRSMSNGGDLNGDGFGDFVVSNSGNEASPTDFSAIEVFYGSANGFASTANKTIQRLASGQLFGTTVEIIDDINNDGMDELMVQELSATGASYLGGTVHMFMGNTSDNFSQTAEWTSEGVSNERLGWMFASAGDVNDDGFLMPSLVQVWASRLQDKSIST